MFRDFPFVESCEPYSIDLYAGKFKFEAWGACGGGGESAGKGGYSSGVLSINKKTKFFVFVGGMGISGTKDRVSVKGGCNGGGNGGKSDISGNYYSGSSGGGATDFRLTTSPDSRILVAGGGGGTCGSGNLPGAYGGGIIAGNATFVSNISIGGSQTYGNENGVGDNGRDSSQFFENGAEGNGGCGGGYRGGTASTSIGRNSDVGGSGGSSYVSGHKECSLYKGYSFKNIEINRGNEYFLSPTGVKELGRYDNGFARISFIGGIQCITYKREIKHFVYFITVLIYK